MRSELAMSSVTHLTKSWYGKQDDDVGSTWQSLHWPPLLKVPAPWWVPSLPASRHISRNKGKKLVYRISCRVDMAVSNRNHVRRWYLSSTSRCNGSSAFPAFVRADSIRRKKCFFFLPPQLWFSADIICDVGRAQKGGDFEWLIRATAVEQAEREGNGHVYTVGDPIYIAWWTPSLCFETDTAPSLRRWPIIKSIRQYILLLLGRIVYPPTTIQLFAIPVEKDCDLHAKRLIFIFFFLRPIFFSSFGIPRESAINKWPV